MFILPTSTILYRRTDLRDSKLYGRDVVSAVQKKESQYNAPLPPKKNYYEPRRKGRSVRLSIRLSVTALGYRHVGCLQLSHERTADPSADGRRSAASRTDIGGGISSRHPRADTLLWSRYQCRGKHGVLYEVEW